MVAGAINGRGSHQRSREPSTVAGAVNGRGSRQRSREPSTVAGALNGRGTRGGEVVDAAGAA